MIKFDHYHANKEVQATKKIQMYYRHKNEPAYSTRQGKSIFTRAYDKKEKKWREYCFDCAPIQCA